MLVTRDVSHRPMLVLKVPGSQKVPLKSSLMSVTFGVSKDGVGCALEAAPWPPACNHSSMPLLSSALSAKTLAPGCRGGGEEGDDMRRASV